VTAITFIAIGLRMVDVFDIFLSLRNLQKRFFCKVMVAHNNSDFDFFFLAAW
jgi:hypothetical protein